jgi:hypothetical protein
VINAGLELIMENRYPKTFLVLLICLALFIGMGLALLVLSHSAAAAPTGTTIVVTATDGGTGGPECRLRDAVTAANNAATEGGCAVTGGAPFIIELADYKVYTFTVVDNPGVGGANALPVIASDITIAGNGSTIARYHLLGNDPAFRLFQVAVTGTLHLIDVEINNGGSVMLGGGVYNLGKTEISDSQFIRNRATDGGGVFNQGTMTVTNSLFSNNFSGCGGAFFNLEPAKLTILGSDLVGNFADT